MSILPDKRSVIHVPIGLLNAGFFWISPMFGMTFGVGFLAYEITQGGKPHIDIQSWLWGLGIGGISWGILLIIL